MKNEIKQELRRLLTETMIIAQGQSVVDRQQFVRRRLRDIQGYCKIFNKAFIVHELEITCDQFDLGGSNRHRATLFRGPNEDASVAICVTDEGSLLHRNGSPWKVFCNAGDISPIVNSTKEKALVNTRS